ncbi:MAG: hypothetical protein ABUL72_04830 [Armatimonadota bacterium]
METYFVIGPDGTEYGPASLEQLKQWQAGGRVASDANLRVVSTGELVAASTLLPAVTFTPPIERPTVDYVPAPPSAPYEPPKQKSSAGWGWIVAIVAFLLIVPCAGMFTMSGNIFGNSRQAAQRTMMLSNAEQVATGIMILLADTNDKFPDFSNPSRVSTLLRPYLKNSTLIGVAARSQYNTQLSNKDSSKLLNPEEVWLLKPTFNDGSGRIPVCFADSHCKLLTSADFSKTMAVVPKWDPTPSAEPEKPKSP